MASTKEIIIHNEGDFKWYKRELDLKSKYEHKHIGVPERYPCKVKSIWEDPPNGPYYHSFTYIKEYICPHCGHKSFIWPDGSSKKESK